MNLREEKALEIVAAGQITYGNRVWAVPSQSGGKPYVVGWDWDTDNGLKCTCKDFEKHTGKCKHIYAVEFSRINELHPASEMQLGNTEPRKTYPQPWAAYNSAQMKEKEMVGKLLKDLCMGIKPIPQKRGRPRIPLGDIVFGAVMKTYSTFSGRRATTDLRDCEGKGLMATAPHYNTIFNYLDDEALTPILKGLIEESAMPLKAIEKDFAIDSSGFSTCTYERWYDTKWGELKSKQRWLKAHITCGVRTNIITSVEVTGSNVNDYTQFVPLIESTAKRFNVIEVSADKAYLGKVNMQAAVDLGATPYIPFKRDSMGLSSELMKKMYHFYKYKQDEFAAHYHKRSNVETTFSMIKRKMGAAIRAKTHHAQVNEILCKILAHNLCCLVSSIHELGVGVEFWGEREAA